MTGVVDAPQLRDHWWPRPGWRPGRRTWTWHLTFEDAPDLHRLVTAYQDALHPLPGLNPVPLRWLHLSMQIVGFEDEVSRDDLDAAISAVRSALATVPPFRLTFGAPRIVAEAVLIPPTPAAPVEDLHRRIRAALGAGPEPGFWSHVSLAYSGIDAPTAPYARAIAAVRAAPAGVTVRAVHLIRQERLLAPDWTYRWDVAEPAPLGG